MDVYEMKGTLRGENKWFHTQSMHPFVTIFVDLAEYQSE